MRTALTRWNPSGDLVRNRFNRLFEDAFNDMLRPFADSEQVQSRGWAPAVDIRENDESLTLFVDLPGLKKDDVSVTLESNVLTISGERRLEREEENDNFHRLERSYGSFSRSFTLNSNVETDEVDAAFNDGVLTIELPKREESKPHRISIK